MTTQLTSKTSPTLVTVGYRVTEVILRRYDAKGNLTLEKIDPAADAAYTVLTEKPGNVAALEAAQSLDGNVGGNDGDIYQIIHEYGARVDEDKDETSLTIEDGDSRVVITATPDEMQSQIERIKATHEIYDASTHNTFEDVLKHRPRGTKGGSKRTKKTDFSI